MEEHDVVVVGSGPGGSIAARDLARKGIDVLLIEKEHHPRYKCCAAGVLWHDIIDFPEIEPSIENYNHGITFHAPSLEQEFSITSKDHYLMAQTYRSTLDAHLAGLASSAGAVLRQGHRVDGLRLDGGRAILEVTDKNTGERYSVKAKVVIGADGVTSIVRKHHPDFPRFKKEDMLIACELDVPMDEKVILGIYGNERNTHIYMYFNDMPGYAWVFTKKNSVSIGMGTMLEFGGVTLGGPVLKENFKSFAKYLEKEGMVVPGSVDLGKTAYWQLPSISLKKAATHGDNALLVGDAAGVFVSALSGEGIYYAMLSGRFAAEATAKALERGDYSKDSLRSYERSWMRRLKTELNYQHFAKVYMLHVKRRCEKAVRWALHDGAIRDFLKVFFTGAYEIDKAFAARLLFHYARLKIKDALGLMGKKEKRS